MERDKDIWVRDREIWIKMGRDGDIWKKIWRGMDREMESDVER